MKDTVNIMIASIYEREDCLLDTVNSLLPQLRKSDNIYLYLQGYKDIPKLESYKKKFKNIHIIYDWEYKDLAANEIVFAELGYFLFEKVNGYILLCDDDLIYPKTYVKDIINKYNLCNMVKPTIVSYHGRIMKKRPIANYYYDSYQYSCLGAVDDQIPCDVLGTGVMCYHSSLMNLQRNSKDLSQLVIHMRDIHIALYAKEHDIDMICLKHDKDYLKYNPKMKDKGTIFDTYANNCLTQTMLINNSNCRFDNYKLLEKEYNPLVNILVINSRQISNPEYVRQTYDSIRNQSYKNIKSVIISNYEKLISIGKCWNDGVKQCTGEWIFFLGDDDFITNDYINTLVVEYNSLPEEYKSKVVGISSYCTLFRDSGEMQRKDIIPTGMWKKEYLLKYPFVEYLTRQVDSSYMDAVRTRGDVLHVVEHSYGLYYRSHNKQVSGMKSIGNEAGVKLSEEVMSNLTKMNLENK